MKETTVAASEFEAKCLTMIDEVAESGNALIITKAGKPVAKVISLQPVPLHVDHRPFLGSGIGEARILGDLINLGGQDDWTGDEANLNPK